MTTAEEYRRCCMADIDAYGTAGYFHDRPWLREAFLATPREHFTPDRVVVIEPDDRGLYRYRALDRSEQPEEWLRQVYTHDRALVTQLDDGATPLEDRSSQGVEPTSSISCPAVVVNMLRAARPEPGQRVLEIGTGTGYNTALLAHRVGAENVTTIEIDAGLAKVAEVKLNELGLAPRVVVGDGEQGHPDRAPYELILSTVGVQEIPRPWLEQLAEGGLLVTPIDSPFHCDGLVRLVGDGRGHARGRLVGSVSFMKTRGQRTKRPFKELGWPTWGDYQVSAGPEGQHIWSRP